MTTTQIIKSNKYKLDIAKRWGWLEGKALELFIAEVLNITQGNIIDGIIYYNGKLNNLQCGKITGFANCLSQIDYMINEERTGIYNG
jgi:hypothetical protein